MLDDLLDMFGDRSRRKRGQREGGLLGRIGQLLEGDSDDSRRDDDRRGEARGDDNAQGSQRRTAFPDPRENDDRWRESNDEDRRTSRDRKRRAFDLEFGDD